MIKEMFNKCETLEELKAVYKRLAMQHHPDRGGDVEIMKQVNALFDEYFETLKNVHRNKAGEKYTKETKETPSEYKDIINELLKMRGVVIEIIGSFIWVSGDTKEHKDKLKSMGFKWHSKKVCWYKPPAGYKKHNNKKYTMNDIRNMFGTSGQFTAEEENAVAVS